MKNKKILSVVVIITFLITTVYPVIGLVGSEADEDKSSETNHLEAVVNYLKNTYTGSFSTEMLSSPSFVAYSKGSEPLSYGVVSAPASIESQSIRVEIEGVSSLASSFNPSESIKSNGETLASYPGELVGNYCSGGMTFSIPGDPFGNDKDFFAEFAPVTIGSGSNIITGSIWVKNSGCGFVQFEISENCEWITSVYPTKGIIFGKKNSPMDLEGPEGYDGVLSGVGQPIDISIEVNADKLSPGSHSAPLTFKYHEWVPLQGDAQRYARSDDENEWKTIDIPVVTTLWADPTEGPSPRYRVLGAESLHSWNIGEGYFDKDSKFSVILDVWDEGIDAVNSFTIKRTETGILDCYAGGDYELYDLNAGVSDPNILVSSMSKTGLYDGEHRYIKAQVPESSGSLSLNFDGIGTYDFSVYSNCMQDRGPSMVTLCLPDKDGKWMCGPACPNPKLYWSNPYQTKSLSSRQGTVVNLGQIPKGQSGSSCFVAWNPVAYTKAPSISWSIYPTTQAELNIFGISFDDVACWNGETQCPITVGNPGGVFYGGGSPFGEGVMERNSRATWDFSARKNLPAGHYIVPMNLVVQIPKSAQDANGRWWNHMEFLFGVFCFEFDIVGHSDKWPSLTKNPVHWPIYDDQTSYTMFDVTSKDKDVLFTPLSSFNFGNTLHPIPLPDEWQTSKIVYDMYPKKPLDWCQLTPSNDYDSDSFIKTNVNNTPAPTTGSNSAKILGVNYRVEDKSSLPLRMTTNSILTESGIESVASKAFFVSSGGYSGEIINMIITNDPDPIADPDPIDPNETDNDSTNPENPEDPDDTNDNGPPKSKTSIFLSFISRFFERLFSFIKSIRSIYVPGTSFT
jgi:hypothetical protein